MVLRKLSQSLRVALALLVATFSNSLLPSVAAYATPGSSITLLPVWCQVTGNGWKAQQGTGDNTQRFPLMGEQSAEYGVVTTENSSLYPTAVLGQTLWKDSSGQIDNILNEACEEQYSSVTPTAPTIKADPCGTASDMYTIPSQPGVIYKVGDTAKIAGDYATGGALSITITAVADTGFVLAEDAPSSWTLTFTNTSCVQIIDIPVVTPSDICGPNNDVLALPTSTNYSLTSDSGWVNGSRTITWTTNAGFVFTGNVTTNTQTFTDVNTLCPPTEINLPTPVLADPCGLNNASWGTQPAVDHVIWSIEEDGDLIATVVGNYTFPNSETSHNFGKAIDSNTPCPVMKPVAPAVTDPCGLANATWTLPSDTTELDWSLVNGVLSVQTKAGYEFTDHTTSIEFGTAPDSGTLCNTTAAPVTVSDLCGTSNDTYTIPSAVHVVYKVGDEVVPAGTYTGAGAVTITTSTDSSDYQLTSPYTFEYEFDNASCEKVTICHRTDAVKNPYVKIEVAKSAVDGLAGNNGKGEPDHFGEHKGPIATSEANAQTLKDEDIKWGDIIPPIEGVHDGLNWTTVGQAMYNNDCNFVTQVTPDAPVVFDLCYSDLDSIMIPSTDGVIYRVNGEIVMGGDTVAFTGAPLVVTAEAADKGHLLTNYTGPWTFDETDFSNVQCLSITKTGKVTEDTNHDGVIGAGDKVTWEITVTNNSNVEFNEAFYVTVEDENAVIENNGLVGTLGAGESKTLTATTTLTASDLQSCKAVNTATFIGTRAQEEVLRVLVDDEMSPLATGSASAEITLTCPNPGRGGGQTLGTATTAELPAALPATGGEANPMLILLASIMAYGVAYFLQGRRQLNQNRA